MSINKILKYFFLGLIQGITEPLPISSSGHIIVLEYFLNYSFDLNFLIFVNLASLLAIIFYYKNFIFTLIKDSFLFIFKKDYQKKNSFKYLSFIIIACIPSGIFGIFFKKYIDSYLSNILTVGLSFLFTSIILFVIANFSSLDEKFTSKNSIIIGLGQIIGLIPGISRSGVTTFCALSQGIDLKKALRFSFLMYIPSSLGATILSLIGKNSLITTFNIYYFFAFLGSFIATFISITFFFKFLNKKSFKIFSLYLLILAIVILIII